MPELALKQMQLVNVPVAENPTDFLNQFTFPNFSQIGQSEVWVVAVTIAIVASLESLLSVEATDKLDPKRRLTNTNRELIAQGAGNMVSGLIGGLPVTQVIVRSSANIHSGAETKLSAIIHGILLLLCVALIPFVLNLVPLATLAAILFMVGYKLAKPATFKQVYKLGWSQFLPFITTVIGVIFTDLLTGIGIGMCVAVVILLKNSFKNSHFLHIENTDGNKHVKMTLAEEVNFLNKGTIVNELNKISSGSDVTIDTSRSVSIDHDVWEIIQDFRKNAPSKNIRVKVFSEKVERIKVESDKSKIQETVNV
jgi:MFS superfamily sulfate permease-like transporter